MVWAVERGTDEGKEREGGVRGVEKGGKGEREMQRGTGEDGDRERKRKKEKDREWLRYMKNLTK